MGGAFVHTSSFTDGLCSYCGAGGCTAPRFIDEYTVGETGEWEIACMLAGMWACEAGRCSGEWCAKELATGDRYGLL